METFKDIPVVHAKTSKEWNKWLAKNHASEKSVWVILANKNSKIKTITHDEAVEEALCYGWIDSVTYKRDAESRYQRFSPRKPYGNWSITNREKAEMLIATGRMQPAGQAMIDIARQNGRWDALVDAQQAIIPPDLLKLLKKNKTALKNFEAFPHSSKRFILEWITNAKKPETRLKRIQQTVELAARNIKANHPTLNFVKFPSNSVKL